MPIDVEELLREEYFQLQRTVQEFDGRTLTIKAWSVTFSAAGLGLAYQQNNPNLLLIAAGSALVFWLIEALWKLYQRAFYARLGEIERYFAAAAPGPIAPLQIRQSWHNAFWGSPPKEAEGRKRRWVPVPFFPGVMLPHVLVAVAGLALWAVEPPKAPKDPPRVELRKR
jgi:hypothetical protein